MSRIRNYSLLAATCLSLSLFNAQATAQDRKTDSSPRYAALSSAVDQALDSALEQNRMVGAVVLVARDGTLIYRRAIGYADREAQIPMQENTLFRLSSLSKIFTTMAAASLVHQGKMNLDDPVTQWLPAFSPTLPNGDTATITIRQLMSHTAGLEYRFHEAENGPYSQAGVSDGLDSSGISLEENLRRIASVPLFYEPGTAWRYSVATDVLGAVIARVNGTSLPQAMLSLVSGPLGLTDSGFVAMDPKRLAVAYRNADPVPVRIGENEAVRLGDGDIIFSPARILDPDAFPSGGAGMAASASDVLNLLEVVRTGGAPLIDGKFMRMINSNQIGAHRSSPGTGFGLGWGVLIDPKEAQTPQSVGTLSWGGVYGHWWFVDPKKKLTVVILTNTAFEGLFGQLVTDVRDAVYDTLPR